MASAASDGVPQINVPATLTAHRALKPRPINAWHRLVPRHEARIVLDDEVKRKVTGVSVVVEQETKARG